MLEHIFKTTDKNFLKRERYLLSVSHNFQDYINNLSGSLRIETDYQEAKKLVTIDKCKRLLLNNTFIECEIDYYQGRTNKQPHGINNKYWQEASKDLTPYHIYNGKYGFK